MRILTLMIATTVLAAPAIAADEFGSRFGNSSPYALDNTVGDAINDTAGLDINDINDVANIEPAAGDEDIAEADKEEAGEENVDKTEEDVVKDVHDDHSGDEHAHEEHGEHDHTKEAEHGHEHEETE